MTRRRTDSHDLKKREHPYRVAVLAAAARALRPDIDNAAHRASEGEFYTWSVPAWPEVLVYGFRTASDRDTFAAWAGPRVPGTRTSDSFR